jgi:chorismate mutase / prephenate dehydratase
VTDSLSPPGQSSGDPLAEARADIDGIDLALLGLIARRGRAADVIAAAKAAEASPLRPGREVALMRRILSSAAPDVDPETLVWVWRGLIGANVRRQRSLEVIAAGGLDAVRHMELARQHFGPLLKVSRESDVRAALSRVAADVVAVTPWPGASGPGMWWPALTETRFQGISIVACLPMRGAEPEAALVATGAPLEPSGAHDHTLLIGFDQRFRVEKALVEAGLAGRLLARANASVLVQIDGFLAPGDGRRDALQTAGLDGARVVGTFSPL